MGLLLQVSSQLQATTFSHLHRDVLHSLAGNPSHAHKRTTSKRSLARSTDVCTNPSKCNLGSSQIRTTSSKPHLRTLLVRQTPYKHSQKKLLRFLSSYARTLTLVILRSHPHVCKNESFIAMHYRRALLVITAVALIDATNAHNFNLVPCICTIKVSRCFDPAKFGFPKHQQRHSTFWWQPTPFTARRKLQHSSSCTLKSTSAQLNEAPWGPLHD